ncbi:MAG: hypothetical protein H8D74_00365 [Chloroflexi bacterium]|nr:hypothetical protein [Chloroflexota bacterium]
MELEFRCVSFSHVFSSGLYDLTPARGGQQITVSGGTVFGVNDQPFDLEETAGYIKHHLRIAGIQGQLLSDSFLAGSYDHTKGVARKINNIGRSALLLGVTERKQILDETDLKRVIHDLEGQLG